MIWLIDGRSGSGKTTFARRAHNTLGWPVVHIEDAYPGWSGLAEGSASVAEEMLNPRRPGFRRWDWYADRFAEFVPTDPTQSMIIEGCGAVTAANIAAARRFGPVWPIWVELDAETRYRRAMARDGNFGPFWHMWARQEDAHIGAHQPQQLAVWTLHTRA
ncbi:hypothetical protein KRX51_03740 [Corynebacterium sp. TAE3-ERU12]|uniref:hypothetical protein n=1 Tax=Corynebacterium sp. TAE3-ERU12 TaxID=2849491 RepID=UPI001C44D62F|nr:hypothetical protein [Corynebacterium sp. TAE3-ERU12]